MAGSALDSASQSVLIVQSSAEAPDVLLGRILAQAGFWDLLAGAAARSGRAADALPILIKPDLDAFARDAPTAASPRLVEHLIDALHARGYADVNVCAAADSAHLWAENRDVAVLADLLGYGYRTPGGHDYDVLDLGEDLIEAPFAPGTVLHGSALARPWLEAGFRICVASNKTDQREGYALALHGLLGVLPLADKERHYRRWLDPGDAVAALLATAGVDFALIDALVSAHGSGGGRAPRRLSTDCLIASPSPLLADFAGALKMGLDPFVSPLAARVFRRLGLPERPRIEGDLTPYPGWQNVAPALLQARRRRDTLPDAEPLLAPWLQVLDAELFPLRRAVDAKVNPVLSRFFADPDTAPLALLLEALADHLLGAVGEALHAWRVLYAKDALTRVAAPLGFDPHRYAPEDYLAIRPALDGLEALLAGTAPATEALCWREIDGATVFRFERELPIPFDVFVARVDVARTIQLMNDYLGGTLVSVEHDPAGRVLCQAERNIYLPQPNYLVLYQGRPIDVSKIECCDYGEHQHRMYWKTIASENGSATHDDGVVAFTRTGRGTRVRILGKQQFTLPPFWQALDLNLVPWLKAALVTHAYDTFFSRTIANFEALVEGRDIRIGRQPHVPAHALDAEPLPGEALERLLLRLGEHLEPLLAAVVRGEGVGVGAARGALPVRVDDQGFRHFAGSPAAPPTALPAGLDRLLAAAGDNLAVWFRELGAAIARDLAAPGGRPGGSPP